MRLTILAVAFAAMACAPYQTLKRPGAGGGDREIPTGTSSRGSGGSGQSDVGRKAVYGKEDPATFVAQDGSRCAVTEKRYRETALGEVVWCAWKW
jgi:hypothetical protein